MYLVQTGRGHTMPIVEAGQNCLQLEVREAASIINKLDNYGGENE